MLRVVLNGKEYEVEEGKKLGDFFKEVGIEGALGAKLGGKIIDLQTPIRESGELVPYIQAGPRELGGHAPLPFSHNGSSPKGDIR
jgi:threonyl-tRNA synthetase